MVGTSATEVRRRFATVLRGDRARALGAIGSGWFLVLSLRFTFPTLLPQFTQTFSLTDTTAGLAITVV